MYKGLAIVNVEFGLRICNRPNSPVFHTLSINRQLIGKSVHVHGYFKVFLTCADWLEV